MFKLAIFATIFALANAQEAQNAQNAQNAPNQNGTRVQRCSKSDPNIDQCFVRNGNLAFAELNAGIVELDIPPLQGFDFGDVFIGQNQDLTFLLEDIKGYLSDINLTAAHLHFECTCDCDWKRVDLNFTLINVGWITKYRALGVINDTNGNHKVNEKGNATIYFGDTILTFSIDFKRNFINGNNFLTAVAHGNSGGSHEKFDFQAKDQKGTGLPLGPERFQELQYPILEKATEAYIKYIVYVFNQILQEIPEDELFLE